MQCESSQLVAPRRNSRAGLGFRMLMEERLKGKFRTLYRMPRKQRVPAHATTGKTIELVCLSRGRYNFLRFMEGHMTSDPTNMRIRELTLQLQDHFQGRTVLLPADVDQKEKELKLLRDSYLVSIERAKLDVLSGIAQNLGGLRGEFQDLKEFLKLTEGYQALKH